LIRPPVAAEVLFFFKQGVHVAKYFRASKLLLNALCIKIKTPPECALYKKICTLINPVGPCMVSSEGTCAAYYRYNGS